MKRFLLILTTCSLAPAAALAAPLCGSLAPLLVPNGYDSASFQAIYKLPPAERRETGRKLFEESQSRAERLTAVSILCSAARDGDADAMYGLGKISGSALVNPPDAVEAFGWYKAGAEGGHPLAMSNLGYAYVSGTGVAIDLDKGIFWFRRAADLGEPWALINLGDAYADGLGVPRDRAEALRLRRKAVTLGGPDFAARLEARGRRGPDWDEPPPPPAVAPPVVKPN